MMSAQPARTHCKDCGAELVRDVNTVPNRVIYIQSRCKDCWNKYYTARNKAIYSTENNRKHELRKKYGMTLEQYSELFNAQGGKCKACDRPSDKTLHVDHDHVTGEIRGLLCAGCNQALGLLEENPDLILALYDYVREHEK